MRGRFQAAAFVGLLTVVAGASPAATVVENGYEVTRNQTVTPAPHGWVGRKTTDRETRTGVVPDETFGNSTEFVMTIGGWARQCPTAAGVVEGVFDYVINKDDVISDAEGTRRTHYGHRLQARLQGQVGDDGKLEYVEIEGEFTRQQEGSPPERKSLPRQRFKPGPQGEPDYAAMRRTVEITGELAFATAMLDAGVFYKHAELEWNNPKTQCVEFSFDPPTESRMLAPNESVDIKVGLRTTGETKAPVDRMGRFSLNAIGGGEVAPPRSSDSPTDLPHAVTYKAADQPRPGHGFGIVAITRAGAAEGQWKITDALKLAIEHHILSRRDSPRARIGGPLYDGTVRFEVTLAPLPLMPGQMRNPAGAPPELRGEATVVRQFSIGHITSMAAGQGTQTETWSFRATLDPGSETLKLRLEMFVDEMDAWWVTPGGREEVTVPLHSAIMLLDESTAPIALSSRSGSRQTLTQGSRDFQETLTIVIPARTDR